MQVQTTDLPLNIIPLKDNRHALVATSGFNTHKLSLIDLLDGKIVASDVSRQSWFGLACPLALYAIHLTTGNLFRLVLRIVASYRPLVSREQNLGSSLQGTVAFSFHPQFVSIVDISCCKA